MEEQRWRKSSRSGNSGGNCVEVATPSERDIVLVRDSKLGDNGPVLAMTRSEWRAFVDGLR